MIDFLKQKFSKDIAPEDEQQLSENIEFLETVLKEEDPDFMKSVGEIDIENAAVEKALAQSTKTEASTGRIKGFFAKFSAKFQSPFWKVVLQPIMIHKHPKKAISFWLVFGGLGFGVFKLVKAHFWHQPTQLFLTSYSALGLQVHDYDMLEQVEPYYDNVRFSKNVMSLIKMTANLRPSENSSNNPMIAFEVVIQGVSNEPIVEIKDREAEFRDLILRVTEEFSYDELEKAPGKQQLSDAILAKVNANLTDGQVRKVYYRNFILKP